MTSDSAASTQLCSTCRGSGCHPDDFGQSDPVLGRLRPCPDCHGRGETDQ